MTAQARLTSSRHGCGIETIIYRGDSVAEACEEVRRCADAREHGLLIALFDRSIDPAQLARTLKRTVAVPTQVCCSTAGGLSPFGYVDGGVIFLLFPASRFEALAALVPNVSSGGLERGTQVAADLLARFEQQVARLPGQGADGSAFGLSFIDGLSNHEEVVVAAFQRALPAIPLVGGSAGDGLAFEATHICLDGTSHTDAAILCLVWSSLPFKLFKSDHYVPTETRLVVTACDPERRLVTELNGVDAAVEYANMLGLDPRGLSPFSFASHPVAVRVGGEHYCRSIRRLEEDGLAFFCAIEDGVVLTIAEAHDMVGTLRQTLEEVSAEIGGIDLAFGFECILRKIEAEERQMGLRMAGVFRDFNVLGFTTYGEQYMSMHLNQTMTGIAFGRAPEDSVTAAYPETAAA